MARGSSLDRILTFGGQAPLTVGALILAMVLCTVAGTVLPVGHLLELQAPPPDAAGWLVLLQAWRLVTWTFFQGALPQSILALIFAGFMLLWLGRQLSFAWSERRFLARFLVLSAGSGAGTLVAGALLAPGMRWEGAWAVVNALLVTWGLIFPNQRMSWFGALEMTGGTVAKVVTIGTPAWALVTEAPRAGLYGALVVYLPHLLAIGLAWLLVAGGPRRSWYRLREWWLRRTLERQRRKFKVISTDRPAPKEWMN